LAWYSKYLLLKPGVNRGLALSLVHPPTHLIQFLLSSLVAVIERRQRNHDVTLYQKVAKDLSPV